MNELLSTLTSPGQPETLYKALEKYLASTIGFGLFTLLYRDGDEVARVYSTNETAYPVFGRKHMGPTPWGEKVIDRQEAFLGPDPEAIIWAFYDHELIFSLGLGAVINIPVVYNGETIGTMNLLDKSGGYTEQHLQEAQALAPLLIPAYLQARRR
ncbi:GAF domain-containing protein [Neorhizobium galegae]|uniref:GAF domain-containing protein n=1 Tax=Neorhizobium galegae TaxID=399 RepID=UPI001AE56E0E|nr:GAF domain-containing protein [Neorhizobium galegae]MBP2563435.1 GAF domain-containing protein [Neorhizobium galegae]MDQ0138229.1 GAF domain-containing protein [Neorhizobium galegae]